MESLCVLGALVFFGLLAYQRVVAQPRRVQDRRRGWQDVAHALGLKATTAGPPLRWTMHGAVSGHTVGLWHEPDEDGHHPVLEVGYPRPLEGLLQIQQSGFEPLANLLRPDIQVGIPDFDHRFRIHSTAPTLLQALFTDEAVHDWACSHEGRPDLTPCLGPCGVERELGTLGRPEALEATIHECIALVQLFTGALDRFTVTLAGRTGLTILPEVLRHLPRLEGARGGVHVDLRQPAEGDGLQLTATVSAPVDPALTIVALQAGSASETGDRVPTLDPILDAHVRVSTVQPEATRSLLTRARTREDLLALMMAHPSARVVGGTVTLLVPTVDPGTVAAALDDVVALAASLSAGRADRVSQAVEAAASETCQ